MRKGLVLGLVETIPVVQTGGSSPDGRYDEDAFFQQILKESKSKFPARNLVGASPRYVFRIDGTSLAESPSGAKRLYRAYVPPP